MFPVPGIPNRTDPEARIREIEDDPLTQLTWWLLDRIADRNVAVHPRTDLSETSDLRTTFTEEEIAFLRSRCLARIATIKADGQPDAIPIDFEFDGAAFYVACARLGHMALNRVALIVDDLLSLNPCEGRGIRIYGAVEVEEGRGATTQSGRLRIVPQATWSWGINGARR